MRVDQLRELFGLDASEELFGDFSCAHTKPRWGAQFLHGQLYVFSTCMVFHAHLIAVVKAVRIYFKDVTLIRKRNFMRMPNTIALQRRDNVGGWHEDVFTSFVFTSRRRAFDTMVSRWRQVNPAAAASYLGPAPGHSTASALTDTDSEMQHAHPQEPFPRPLRQLLLPAASAAAALQPPEGVELRQVAAQRLEGDAQQVAHVLLSDTSGFLPRAMSQQGNQLVSMTPWQVVPSGHPRLQPGSLQRTFKYTYSSNAGAWGPVRSIVVQEQVLKLFDDGRLLLEATQSMPDLPAGVGKAVSVIIRWLFTPTISSSNSATAQQQGAAACRNSGSGACEAMHSARRQRQQQPASAPVSVHGSAPSTPRSWHAGSRTAADAAAQQQQQQEDVFFAAHGRSPFGGLSDAPTGAAGSRPGSFMGLTGPQQQQQQQQQQPSGLPAAAAQATPAAAAAAAAGASERHHNASSVSSSSEAARGGGSQQLVQQLHASSCPNFEPLDSTSNSSTWQQQQQQHCGSELLAVTGADSDRPSADRAALPIGHAHILPAANNGSGGSSSSSAQPTAGSRSRDFLTSLRGSFRDLQQSSPLLRLRKSNSISSTISTASSGAPRADSPVAGGGSVLGSVHEDPDAEHAAAQRADKQQQEQLEDVAVRHLSYSSSRGRGRDQAEVPCSAACIASAADNGEAQAAAAHTSASIGSAQHQQQPPPGSGSSSADANASSEPASSKRRALLGRPTPPASPRAVAATLFGLGGGSSSPRVSTFGGWCDSDLQAGQAEGQWDSTGGRQCGNESAADVAASEPADSKQPQQFARGQQQQQPAAQTAASASTDGGLHCEAKSSSSSSSSSSSDGSMVSSHGCAAAGSIEWQVSVGVQWVRWHIAQRMITDDTLSATSASQQAVLRSGLAWMQQPSEREALSAVMPQSSRLQGARKFHHRGSSSAGSAGRSSSAARALSLAGAAGASRRAAAGLLQRHTTGQEGQGWLARLLGWLGSALLQAGEVCVGLVSGVGGQRVTLAGAVLLSLSLGHLVLLWKVIQLLSVLVDKLDSVGVLTAPAAAAATAGL